MRPKKGASAELGQSYNQQRSCPVGAMDAATAKPQPGRGAGNQSPPSLLPAIACCCLPLLEPKRKPETKGAQMVQAQKAASFPECRAERGKYRADLHGETRTILHKRLFPKYGPCCICVGIISGACFESRFLGSGLDPPNQNISGAWGSGLSGSSTGWLIT